jgi:hypothetical protein
MCTRTISVDADQALLATLTDILEIDSEVEAAEIGLRLLVHILEIEALNLSSGDRYWPDFDPAEYLRLGRRSAETE